MEEGKETTFSALHSLVFSQKVFAFANWHVCITANNLLLVLKMGLDWAVRAKSF